MDAPRPLGFMTAINATVAYYDPSINEGTATRSTSTSTSDPRLIVLLTWYAANDIHIAKYIHRYRDVFPHARVLLIRCPARHFILPWTIQGDLKPALEAMCDNANRASTTTRPKVLLHIFSNGGCNTAHNLLKAMHQRAASKSAPLVIPRYTLILDSCPGTFEWKSTCAALMQPLPRAVGPLIYILIGIVWAIYRTLPLLPVQDRNGATLLEAKLLEYESTRTYLFSAADTFVPCEDVRHHAARAKAAGFNVFCEENFHDAGHVALAKAEPDRYWKVIENTWFGAQK